MDFTNEDDILTIRAAIGLLRLKYAPATKKKQSKTLIREKRAEPVKTRQHTLRVSKEKKAMNKFNRSNAMKAMWAKRKAL